MNICSACALVATLAAFGISLQGETIGGNVVIKKVLTRRRVTTFMSLYERGLAVGLGADAEIDPIALERSRVVVYLEGRLPLPTGPAVAARIEQENRRFTPETLVIQAGSKVSFPNLDPIFHNVFSLSRTKTFDLGNYPMGQTRVVTFSDPGIVFVNCHLHSNMTATIVVVPNQWNARVNRDGTFELHDVPPGKYTIVAWHKVAGSFREPIEVLPDHRSQMDFFIPLEFVAQESDATGRRSKK